MTNHLERYNTKEDNLFKNIDKSIFDRFEILIDDLPDATTLSLFQSLDFFRIEASEKEEQKILSTLLFMNYLSDYRMDFVENFKLFKNLEIDTKLFKESNCWEGSNSLNLFVESSLLSNSYEAFDYIVKNYSNEEVSQLLLNNINHFKTLCRNKDIDMRFLETIHDNKLLDLNNLQHFKELRPLIYIIGSKKEVGLPNINENIFKFLVEKNYDLDFKNLHIRYGNFYNKIERAYNNLDENKKNLSELLSLLSQAFTVPDDKDNICVVDNILGKFDSFKKMILDYKEQIDLGTTLENRLKLQEQNIEIER